MFKIQHLPQKTPQTTVSYLWNLLSRSKPRAKPEIFEAQCPVPKITPQGVGVCGCFHPRTPVITHFKPFKRDGSLGATPPEATLGFDSPPNTPKQGQKDDKAKANNLPNKTSSNPKLLAASQIFLVQLVLTKSRPMRTWGDGGTLLFSAVVQHPFKLAQAKLWDWGRWFGAKSPLGGSSWVSVLTFLVFLGAEVPVWSCLASFGSKGS